MELLTLHKEVKTLCGTIYNKKLTLNALNFASTVLNILETTGPQPLPMFCSKTAPIPKLKTSVEMEMMVSGDRKEREKIMKRAFLAEVKVLVQLLVSSQE